MSKITDIVKEAVKDEAKDYLQEAITELSTAIIVVTDSAVDAAVDKLIIDLREDSDRTSKLFVKLRNSFYIAGLSFVKNSLSTLLKEHLSKEVEKLVKKLSDE